MLNWLIKRMKRDQKGFTLIELIVVIAILGVLSAIAVPNVMGTLARSRTDADKATAVTIANAALEYVVRHPEIDDDDLDGAITDKVGDEDAHPLVEEGYLNEAPKPQDTNYQNFYLDVDTNDTTNPTIKVYYGNNTDGILLYSSSTEED